MGMIWKVRPIEASTLIEEGSPYEPFAYDPANDMFYTKEQTWTEEDEPLSSTKQQSEREAAPAVTRDFST